MLNLSILQGRIVAKPELEKSSNEKEFCKFTLAVQRMNNDDVDFIDCVCFNKVAINLCNYINKGDKLIVTGKIQTQSYTDNKDIKRKSTVIIAQQIHYPDKKYTDEDNYNDIPPIQND